MKLGVSRRQIYVLLGRYRQGSGLVTDLALHRSTGGKGGNRLSEQVEDIVRGLIRRRFLTRQKLSVAALHREMRFGRRRLRDLDLGRGHPVVEFPFVLGAGIQKRGP